MNNYIIHYNGDYGIYTTDKSIAEMKLLFSEHADIRMIGTIEQLQQYAKDNELNYVGFDMFYR